MGFDESSLADGAFGACPPCADDPNAGLMYGQALQYVLVPTPEAPYICQWVPADQAPERLEGAQSGEFAGQGYGMAPPMGYWPPVGWVGCPPCESGPEASGYPFPTLCPDDEGSSALEKALVDHDRSTDNKPLEVFAAGRQANYGAGVGGGLKTPSSLGSPEFATAWQETGGTVDEQSSTTGSGVDGSEGPASSGNE